MSNFPIFCWELKPRNVRAENVIQDHKKILLVIRAGKVLSNYLENLTQFSAGQSSKQILENYFFFLVTTFRLNYWGNPKGPRHWCLFPADWTGENFQNRYHFRRKMFCDFAWPNSIVLLIIKSFETFSNYPCSPFCLVLLNQNIWLDQSLHSSSKICRLEEK